MLEVNYPGKEANYLDKQFFKDTIVFFLSKTTGKATGTSPMPGLWQTTVNCMLLMNDATAILIRLV